MGSVVFSCEPPLTLKSDCLEIGFIGGQSTLSSEVSGALSTALEKPKERFIHTPGRTYNRIRSPRLAASGRLNKVGKGSRQTRSVTSGKGLALRVGYRSPCSDVRAEQKLLDALGWIVDSRMARIAGQGTPFRGFSCALNNQLRTGADKGNPTV